MKRQLRSSLLWVSACALVALSSMASPAVAGPYSYTIIENQSQINLTASGDLLGGTMTVEEQFPSDVTRYTGSIAADFVSGANVGGTIQFPGGGAATAGVLRGGFLNLPRSVVPGVGGSGSGSAANYGITLSAPVGIEIPEFELPDYGTINLGTLESVDVDFALRDLVLDVSSVGGGSVIGPGGSFDASSAQISIASGFADIRGSIALKQDNFIVAGALYLALQSLVSQYPDLGLTVGQDLVNSIVTLGFGSRVDLSETPDLLALPNSPSGDGTVTYNIANGFSTLTLPVNSTIALDEVGLPGGILQLDLNLAGTLVATAIVPEPASIGLACVGLGVVAAWGIRRRRQS